MIRSSSLNEPLCFSLEIGAVPFASGGVRVFVLRKLQAADTAFVLSQGHGWSCKE